MKTPRISIVIPTYNEEKDIGKCLESLRDQSIENFGVLIVDDGSTDKTIDVVKKFKDVGVIKGEHKGTAFSRNLCAENAKGEILVFVDADMTFDKNYLTIQISDLHALLNIRYNFYT
jgi:glycosyltransferase involved in cell wall biosynthesis